MMAVIAKDFRELPKSLQTMQQQSVTIAIKFFQIIVCSIARVVGPEGVVG
jgi:hypothetical protein